MKNLPKQSQPVVRNIDTISTLSPGSGVNISDFMNCYKLKGMARNICLAAY